MRQDQFEGLQSRLEQLVDVFLTESNPDKCMFNPPAFPSSISH